jgi:serine-type D-Ala-D-Ala carboxypeptidase/endopeptidase (penicillin-binding protein 4)
MKRQLTLRVGISWALLTLGLAITLQARAQALPPVVADGLKAAGIPLDAASVYVQKIGTNEVAVAHQSDAVFNPASVMKLPTTLAALELLGPAHTFTTQVFVTAEPVKGKLEGDLYFKGGGDPKLTIERYWLLLKTLRERGLASLHGDVVIDRRAFASAPFDAARFDGEPLKAHNVGPDALLLNLKAVRFFFVPRDDRVLLYSEPALPGITIQNEVKLVSGGCGDWRERLTRSVQQKGDRITIQFRGNYAASCGEGAWNLSLFDADLYSQQLFRSVWTELGGFHKGGFRAGSVPADARLFATFQSPALADIVRDINKFSNNVMARQVFLALSAGEANGASTEASDRMIRAWLKARGIEAPEIVFENGSGLSRRERMSTRTTVAVLQQAWRSPVLGDFLASLPLVGSDGTMRKRLATDGGLGYAHIKGGTLNGVRAIAGYVLDRSGQRWAVAFTVNHPNAANLQAVQDGLLDWVYRGRG